MPEICCGAAYSYEQIEVGAIHCGALLDFLSQYPGEGELLFGPLSYLEVVGDPVLEMHQVATDRSEFKVRSPPRSSVQ
jgi:hypothetical protein